MRQLVAGTILISMAAGGLVLAQTPPAAPTGQKTLAATMNVYAFPTKGQSPSQQSEDEAACYQYATQSTGVDPFSLQKQAQQQQQQAAEAQKQSAEAQKQAQQAGKGAGAAGAVGGAAAGALIGEIASDDAGKGAAYGAAAGLLVGRRKSKQAKEQATEQAEQQGQQAQQQSQQAQQATQQQMDNFKKAFSVCMEAKNYMVKY